MRATGDGRPAGPLAHATMPQGVHAWLVRMIADGELTIGQRLDEASLAAALGVSRTPVREAIRRLAGDGLAEHRPYQGHFIRTFSVKQVDDLYEFRKALEALALRQVAAAHEVIDFAPLRDIVRTSGEHLAAGERGPFEAADRAFHDWIAQASGNEMVLRALEGIELQIQLLRQVANQQDDFRDESQRQREGILARLTAGDGEAAADLMIAHISAAQAAALASLRAHLDASAAGATA